MKNIKVRITTKDNHERVAILAKGLRGGYFPVTERIIIGVEEFEKFLPQMIEDAYKRQRSDIADRSI